MERTIHPTLAAVSGLCAIFIGLGLCRFAYNPMVPALISQGWVSALDASHLIAINLIGYFIGAVWLKFYGKNYNPIGLTYLALIVCSISLFGRAIDLWFIWFVLLRFAMGFFGAVLVIITASFIVTTNPQHLRTRTNAIIFTGMGMGIAVAGVLVAAFAHANVSVVWFAIALVCLLSAIVCWMFLPKAITQPPYVFARTTGSIKKKCYLSYACLQLPGGCICTAFIILSGLFNNATCLYPCQC